ncbi:acyltransferase [Maridesulfovibrio hydrothermalis]|uniref:Transferase hexapeptide repeat containing protein n=1 Tax=Maridesulfovibrio hydrothermalis AM13 = DSM 14728 TaxID=1121451 RepID=L0RAI9_9BACT|nr:acyltransferase [Maridesulfovibrio hydrothermalis]CCO23205.1 Transferase hexapeptide repeat containing protein [Maridesulfovibrio hydrothermalis AM13 = DSM 14728]
MYIDKTALVEESAIIGEGTYIWQNAQVRANAQVGTECIIGKGAFIDFGVIVGSHVKIQNYANIFRGVTIEDGVFIGPTVCFTNDLFPRAVDPEGNLKDYHDWKCYETRIKTGAGIGAGSVIVCNTTIGKWAIIGAGSIVTRDVPDHALVFGNPARIQGFVCHCGAKLPEREDLYSTETVACIKCSKNITLPACPELKNNT